MASSESVRIRGAQKAPQSTAEQREGSFQQASPLPDIVPYTDTPPRLLTPANVLHLQRTIGNHAVQQHLGTGGKSHTDVIQRVKTPVLSETIGYGFFENKQKLKPVFKQTLILLRAQLRSTNVDASQESEKTSCLREVDRLIGQIESDAEIEQAVMNAIVARVNNLIPGKVSQGTQAEALKADEETKFDNLVTEATDRIDAAVKNNAALEATFTGKIDPTEKKASTDKAINNYALIRAHILKWKTEKANRVRINRVDAEYGGYNTGTGDQSKLMLSNKSFTKPAGEVAGTIIHEASHGSISTKDHAYMNAPYFLSLPDQHRLDNADHYKYAPEVAKGEKDPSAIGALGGSDPQIVKDFKMAKDLAFYKANKIWTYLMWMKDSYSGNLYIDETTKAKHSKWLGLQDRTSKAIHKENTQLLIEFYNAIKFYISQDMDILPTAVPGELKMKPKTGKVEITVGGLTGMSVDAMSGAILDAMAGPYGLPASWNINKIGMKLFKRIFVKEKDTVASQPGNKPSALEVELYKLFGGEGRA